MKRDLLHAAFDLVETPCGRFNRSALVRMTWPCLFQTASIRPGCFCFCRDAFLRLSTAGVWPFRAAGWMFVF